ncbi:envelope stress sensor histidine kinase CpxA [Erwiniaceae bacterium L1_54_6]|jgi:two-component system, OmpR family, sensor histidine kinase CpxA|uniref:histidine kinase n=2 Tax=Pantoea TaxID=53335 RepID=A0A1X1F019_PANCY|nr:MULTISPECIES: envelope stress sensor histidine kinase CpxA [Pantoea]MDF7662369.1 envelope stress sensor histidine kinase CpxA [Erwiniaceae bacterium L1_54_6]MBP2195675.1 two-component system sensor histidine kinase CpxA [Pantoea cypripedii]MDE1185810.1 envelope stress sensor histidine kinase CpxA [Pantoea sp.]ORM95504.1 two-component system sensor histidine kinase CpxA [Pantoea cypripedii]QGY31026.1 two-component system sensor histidine kinase CpxA [Pantoea cypripedii]
MIGSLTTRIFAIFWLTLALVLMLVLMVPKLDSRQMTSLLESEQRQGIMIEQHVEAELAQDPPNDLMWWRRLFRAIEKWAPPGQRLLLVTSEGRVIGAQHNEMQVIRNFIGQSDNADHPQKKKYGRVEMVGPFAVRDGEDNYQLYLIRPATSSQLDFVNLLFDRPLLLLIVTMLISSPLLLWLAWSLARPARKLKHAADEVASGNLRQHPELESGPQEFLAAGSSFNQMVSALERMMTAQQRLLSDISHELRTPLTRLQLATALLRRRQGEGKELERIETEAQRLDGMINDLLVLSRTQHKNALVSEAMKANHLWNGVLEDAKFEAEQMGKRMDVPYPPGPWPLYGNPHALESALENIVRNALRYSHTHISVSFSVDIEGITVHVDDDGPGVSPEDREQIFRPFYRTDEARDRESGGTGLGLAIVETAVQQHRGWVKADDSPLGGLRLTLWLPLYSARQ